MVQVCQPIQISQVAADRPVIGVCTYFDAGYLTRAVALYRSLARFHADLRWFFFCMDDVSLQIVQALRLPNLTAVSRQQLEAADPQLAATARNRSTVEYYFTCTAPVMLQSLQLDPQLTQLFYVDADVCFFDSLDSLLLDMQQASVYITEHRFPPHLQHLLVYGRFNVGIIGVTRCPQALDCLWHYRKQCLEWCYDRLEGDRFGDQKYLDAWPALYSQLKIAQHPGVNAAPWNKDVSEYARDAEGFVRLNGQPLVCYHFQGLRVFPGGLVMPQAIDYDSRLSDALMNLVYMPYLHLLQQAAETCGLRANSLRYATAPRLLSVFRSRRRGRYWVQTIRSWAALTVANAWLLVPLIAVRRLFRQ